MLPSRPSGSNHCTRRPLPLRCLARLPSPRRKSGVLAIGAAASALVLLIAGCADEDASNASLAQTIPVAQTPPADAFTLRLRPEVRKTIEANPVLRDAPWLVQPNGSPRLDLTRLRPSLVFPPGTTYPEAIKQLVNAVSVGRFPVATTLGPPLPPGVVYDATADQGFALDLQAPFGYDPEGGAVAAPLLELPGEWTQEQVFEAVEAGRRNGGPPVGARPSVPFIPTCQTMEAYKSQPARLCDAAR